VIELGTVATFGPVRLSSVNCPAPTELIRPCGSDHYQVTLAHAGQVIGVVVPRTTLPLPVDTVEAITDVEGVAELAADFAARLLAGAGTFSAPTRTRLGLVLLDLLSTALSSCFDLGDALSADDRHRVRLAQIDGYIWRNLGDPQLSPPVVAAANHISLRYLHRIFSDEHGQTIGAFIREARLQRCRRDLADPLLASWSIERIARRWGFTDLASFSRTFKQALGVSPSAYRASIGGARTVSLERTSRASDAPSSAKIASARRHVSRAADGWPADS
jgi:AraC-like DNA-binding protein